MEITKIDATGAATHRALVENQPQKATNTARRCLAACKMAPAVRILVNLADRPHIEKHLTRHIKLQHSQHLGYPTSQARR